MSGGYARIGNIVVVNIRINTNNATIPAGSQLITGFPTYTAPANFVWVFNNLNKTIALSTYGNIYNSDAVAGQIVCSCVYMAD